MRPCAAQYLPWRPLQRDELRVFSLASRARHWRVGAGTCVESDARVRAHGLREEDMVGGSGRSEVARTELPFPNDQGKDQPSWVRPCEVGVDRGVVDFWTESCFPTSDSTDVACKQKFTCIFPVQPSQARLWRTFGRPIVHLHTTRFCSKHPHR